MLTKTLKSMKSEPLDKLEKLAEQRAERSRGIWMREQQVLDQIDEHCRELRMMNHEYQNSLLGDAQVSPQLLAHRRNFVQQLSKKLDELKEQRVQKHESVEQKADELRMHSAQQAAIQTINDARAITRDSVLAKREQQQLDGNAQIQHIQRQYTDGEQGND